MTRDPDSHEVPTHSALYDLDPRMSVSRDLANRAVYSLWQTFVTSLGEHQLSEKDKLSDDPRKDDEVDAHLTSPDHRRMVPRRRSGPDQFPPAPILPQLEVFRSLEKGEPAQPSSPCSSAEIDDVTESVSSRSDTCGTSDEDIPFSNDVFIPFHDLHKSTFPPQHETQFSEPDETASDIRAPVLRRLPTSFDPNRAHYNEDGFCGRSTRSLDRVPSPHIDTSPPLHCSSRTMDSAIFLPKSRNGGSRVKHLEAPEFLIVHDPNDGLARTAYATNPIVTKDRRNHQPERVAHAGHWLASPSRIDPRASTFESAFIWDPKFQPSRVAYRGHLALPGTDVPAVSADTRQGQPTRQ